VTEKTEDVGRWALGFRGQEKTEDVGCWALGFRGQEKMEVRG
jgi:hypothetical protein